MKGSAGKTAVRTRTGQLVGVKKAGGTVRVHSLVFFVFLFLFFFFNFFPARLKAVSLRCTRCARTVGQWTARGSKTVSRVRSYFFKIKCGDGVNTDHLGGRITKSRRWTKCTVRTAADDVSLELLI